MIVAIINIEFVTSNFVGGTNHVLTSRNCSLVEELWFVIRNCIIVQEL